MIIIMITTGLILSFYNYYLPLHQFDNCRFRLAVERKKKSNSFTYRITARNLDEDIFVQERLVYGSLRL